ncbi:substrate-binding domain-containing protein [Armatimonas sp.]|uniref:substrate-binding domain-containing protein n=1 Tax=Armatimonas sp. TaxID=1872638 RepID=UPI003750000A
MLIGDRRAHPARCLRAKRYPEFAGEQCPASCHAHLWGLYAQPSRSRCGLWRTLLTRWHALAERPTAVFCANDTLAQAALALAHERGWHLAVVGVDNAYPGSGLTSVDPSGEALGRESVRTLQRLIDGAPLDACRVEIPACKLHARASTETPP